VRVHRSPQTSQGRSFGPTRGVSVGTGEQIMSRYVAPLGFTLAAMWVVVVFVLVRATP
jgi:hypothetical protein